MSLKRTAFYDMHVALNAKIVEFAGFEMPIQYSGIIDEHKRVRETVGVFDVSHMGEVGVRGKDALAFLQKITVNDVAKLSRGRVQYSAMCYEDGGIVDDLLVYCLGENHYMLVINASNIDKDFAWMQKNCLGDVTLKNQSDEISLLAIQGQKSLATLQQLTDVDLSKIEYYHFVEGKLAGVDMIISRTGYTGELGFEIYFAPDVATGTKIWNAVMEAGKKFDIGPIGLGARDTLRLEMGFCLYGNDIDQTTHPLEAGLGWITKLDKGEFNGKSVMTNAKAEGLKRKLVGFTLAEKAFPRHGYAIHSNGNKIGDVTSGTFSPILDQGIGMGYVPLNMSKPGTEIAVMIRNKETPATVTALPFIKH
ncbi:MAG: glycine cleavage system aminomethyltransferase GcvT [Ignavibacteriae bacterium]|nr:glycine cleavage system aminomethyltransferase GcvT [Ignavibacteriota bacterium]